MTAFPRVLLAERRCTSCGCIFARVPDKTIDPERCGFCLAHLDVDPPESDALRSVERIGERTPGNAAFPLHGNTFGQIS